MKHKRIIFQRHKVLVNNVYGLFFCNAMEFAYASDASILYLYILYIRYKESYGLEKVKKKKNP